MFKHNSEVEDLQYIFQEAQKEYLRKNHTKLIKDLDQVDEYVCERVIPKIKRDVQNWVENKSKEFLIPDFQFIPVYKLELTELEKHPNLPYLLSNLIYHLGKIYPSVFLNIYNPSHKPSQYTTYKPRSLKSEILAGMSLLNNTNLSQPEVVEKSFIAILFSE